MPSVAAALPVLTIPRIRTGRHARNPVTITIPVTAMGRGGQAALALSAVARRLTKKRSGIFAGDSIREPAKVLVRGAGERHRAGWDITFSTPKTFGILWAAGTTEQRSVLEGIQQDAVDQALEFVADEGLIQVRLGAGGHLQEVPADIVVAKFPHFTSREGDPACHTHCVLLNVARSASGNKYLTVEPRRAYEWQLVLGSAFRSALAKRLAEMGFSLREAGRDQFEIAGVPRQ